MFLAQANKRVKSEQAMQKIPTLQKQLALLVATPSISSTDSSWDTGNIDVINLLATWLEDLNFDVKVQPLLNSPHKANLIATLNAKSKGREGLVLAGHTDTVPYDEERWQSDPFKLIEKDNCLFGLGSTDMKGFFPIAIEAVKAFTEQELTQPLTILATADEESTMNGARQLILEDFAQAKYALIGEPTSLRPIRMHKGMMMEAIRIEGRAGHSSNPNLGNNALDAMTQALNLLIEYRQQLKNNFCNDAFEIVFPTLNLGCIHGGDSPNRICGRCELHFDLRPLPGMDIKTLRDDIAKKLKPLNKKFGVSVSCHKLLEPIEPFEQAEESEWVKVCQNISAQPAGAIAFSTEAPFLQNLGLETLVMGPGNIDQAHQANEYLSLGQINPAVEMLQKIITTVCME